MFLHVETIFGVLSLIPLISTCILSPFIYFFSLVSPLLPIFSLPTCLPDISCSTNIFHTYLLVHIPSNQLAITFWHRVWFQEADIHHSDAAPLNVSIVRCIVKNLYYYNVYYSLFTVLLGMHNFIIFIFPWVISIRCIILLFSHSLGNPQRYNCSRLLHSPASGTFADLSFAGKVYKLCSSYLSYCWKNV